MKFLFHHRIGTRHGQAVHMDELIDALRAGGHEVVVVGPSVGEAPSFGAVAPGVGMLKQRVPRWLYELGELAYNVVDLARLVRAARRERPDAVYERYALFLVSGALARRLLRIPLLLEVNSPMFEERASFGGGISLSRLAGWSQRFTWRAADVVLPVTDVLAAHVRGAGVDGERVVVIHNGVDRQRFRPGTEGAVVRDRLGLGSRCVLGFTGFVREWHRVDRIVELLPDLARRFDAHLVVVGDGPVRVELEAQARAAGVGDRLTVLGTVGRDDVAAHIAAFDVALQIGVTPYASPLKLFEYMAVGRAIIAPDVPNIREVLTDGENAVLFDPDDERALAAAIERLAGDPGLRARLGAAASATIEERGFTWAANARRVVELAATSDRQRRADATDR